MSEYYGRGCINPYQYFVNDDGDIIENRFGEINRLGKVINPEMMDEAKRDVFRAFSIIDMSRFYHDLYPYQQRLIDYMWLSPRQSGKESTIVKLIRECQEQNVPITAIFEEWKRRELLEIMKYDSIDAINRVNIYDHDKCLGYYSFDIAKLVEEYKEQECARTTMKMLTKGINKNNRVYLDEFNPFERGQHIFWFNSHKPEYSDTEFLQNFIYENRYGGFRKDNKIPHIKLNIERKKHAKRTNFGNRFK